MGKVPNEGQPERELDLIERAVQALRSWSSTLTVEQAADLLDSWKYVGQLTLEQRAEVLDRFTEGQAVPVSAADTPAHEIRIQQMPGGPVEVRCSCGTWGGVAPSVKVAERDGAQHVEKQTATDGERRAWWRGYAAAWRDATSHSTTAADAHAAGYLSAVQSTMRRFTEEAASDGGAE